MKMVGFGSADSGRTDSELSQMDEGQLLTEREVAKLLAVCGRTIRRLVAAGELKAPVHVGRASRWFTRDVVEYLENLKARRDQKRPQEVVS